MIRHEDIDDGPITSKMHKVCCCSSCCLPCNCLFHPCRQAVSGSKKRYRKDGFDLDMAYVAPNIIVHGFPAAGLEHIYRNPRLEIKRYMDAHHFDRYKMYNFCCEPGRGYDPSIFHGRVERYPFKDHNTPPLETMAAFANSVKAWLDANPENVINIHCKAGKGRAGLMCCVALIRTGVAQSAQEALDIYDRERVTNNRGLTVTSQRKFVLFYERLWRSVWNVKGDIGQVPAEPLDSTKWVVPAQPAMRLFGVEVVNLPPRLAQSYRITIFRISNFLPEKRYDSKWLNGSGSVDHFLRDADGTVLEGNFKVFISFKKGFMSKPVKLMELLHNTYFMENDLPAVDFPQDQLDIKKKLKPKLGADIILRLKFAPAEESNDATAAAGTVAAAGRGQQYELVQRDDGNSSSSEGVLLGAPEIAAAAGGGRGKTTEARNPSGTRGNAAAGTAGSGGGTYAAVAGADDLSSSAAAATGTRTDSTATAAVGGSAASDVGGDDVTDHDSAASYDPAPSLNATMGGTTAGSEDNTSATASAVGSAEGAPSVNLSDIPEEEEHTNATATVTGTGDDDDADSDHNMYA